MLISQRQEKSSIDKLLSCQCAEIVSVLKVGLGSHGRSTYTILNIAAISRVIFDPILRDDEKQSLIIELISSNENIGNQLFKQIPATFLFQLLMSIELLGVNIEPLLKGVDLQLHENGLANLQVLGDFTDNRFLESLLRFYKELDDDRYQKALSVVIKKAVKKGNFGLFEALIGKNKKNDIDPELMIWVVNAFLQSGETQKALKLYDSVSDKPMIISVISNYYLENDQYGAVLNLLKLNDDPLIKFELLISMINYHIDQRSLKVIDVMCDQALELRKLFSDPIKKGIASAKLADVELKRGRIKVAKGHIDDVLEIIENVLDFKSGCIVFNDLFTRLVINEKYEMADDLLKDRWSGGTCEGQIQFDCNHVKDVSYTIQKIIKQIDFLSFLTDDNARIEIERLHACALTSLMFLRDLTLQDHLLHQIAKSYLKYGYYEPAIEIQHNIEDNDYRDHLKSMIPLYSTGNGNYGMAIDYVNKIDFQQIRVETKLILFPFLMKDGYQIESIDFLRSWMEYKIQNI